MFTPFSSIKSNQLIADALNTEFQFLVVRLKGKSTSELPYSIVFQLPLRNTLP